ncbi:MAG: YcaO-like family protein, partial [Paracoccaceae bacterium]
MTIGDDLAQIANLFKPRFFQSPDLPVILAVALPTERLRETTSFPECALPEAGRIASGRGLSENDALRTALGEAVELVSCCRWDDDLRSFGDIPSHERHLQTRDVFGFSPEQEAVRERWNDLWGDHDPWPEVVGDDAHLWVCGKAQSSNSTVWISADALFVGGATGQSHNPMGSTGCASAPSLEAAIEAGLLELVERDAVGRWWWQKRAPQALPHELLDPWPELRAALRQRDRVTRLAILDSRFGIPCVIAFSHEPDGRFVACGFSADHDWHDAALAAVLEMADSEFRLRISSNVPENGVLREWMHRITAADARLQLSAVKAPPSPQTEALKNIDQDIFIFNMTRSQIR